MERLKKAMRQLEVPIILIFFNRKELALKAFKEIRRVKPQKLFLVSDGPRQGKTGELESVAEIRQCIEQQIDWECDIQKLYAEENMGCRARISSAISEVFEQEEMAIIVEDDVIAMPSFFYFCEELLVRYKDVPTISYITGHKVCEDYDIKESYIFSRHPNIWGWATWKRAWSEYNDSIDDWYKIKNSDILEKYYNKKISKIYKTVLEKAYTREIDSWGYIWTAACAKMDSIGIVPKYNLIRNEGFGDENATHTRGKSPYKFDRKELEFPLEHPKEIMRDEGYDRVALKQMEKEMQGPPVYIKAFRKIMRTLRKK